MNDYAFENVPLVVKHVPDFSQEVGPDGNKVRVELPGKYHIGAVIEGAFVPLAAIGKSRLHKHIDRAKAQQPQHQPEAEQQA